VEVVAPGAGVKVPAPALNVPPVPVSLDQVPPLCSPVIKLYKSISAVELSQTEVLPSVPAFGCAVMFTVATDASLGQGDVPVTKYWKVDVVAPGAGVKVPEAATNVPPVPVNLDQVPPLCSPVIKLYRSIGVIEFSQTVVLPSVPAFACAVMFTVATDASSGQGAVPVIKYWKVDVVAPGAGVKVPAPALNVPPVPVNLDQVPPVCSPPIKLYKSIGVVELSQTEVLPSVPAFACAEMFTVAIDASSGQGDVPVTKYWKVDVVAPGAGVYVPVPALNVPPVPVNLDHVPPVCSPVIKL
jgi:hypothetical protein